ncbi:unnamed protein product, partial [Gadus morhua 'NCC']
HDNQNRTTASQAAGVAFDGLLRAARSRWPKVFVLDFPPRLASELAPQQFLREEFRRVAAKNDTDSSRPLCSTMIDDMDENGNGDPLPGP